MDSRSIIGYLGALIDSQSIFQILRTGDNYKGRLTLIVKNEEVQTQIGEYLRSKEIVFNDYKGKGKSGDDIKTFRIVLHKKESILALLKMVYSYHYIHKKSDIMIDFLLADDIKTRKALFEKIKPRYDDKTQFETPIQ